MASPNAAHIKIAAMCSKEGVTVWSVKYHGAIITASPVIFFIIVLFLYSVGCRRFSLSCPAAYGFIVHKL